MIKIKEKIVDEWHHGTFKKLRLLAVNELPECNKCLKPIDNECFIWYCVEDEKFYHYDCFDSINHPHTIKDGQHTDNLCRIILNPKLFEEKKQ